MSTQSLFGSLATRFSSQPENLATEALLYIINPIIYFVSVPLHANPGVISSHQRKFRIGFCEIKRQNI
jgi:hypothetical protein